MLINYDGLYSLDIFDNVLKTSFGERITKHRQEGSGNSCRYDSAGIALSQLAITEIVVFGISQTGKYSFNYIFFGKILGNHDWKPSR